MIPVSEPLVGAAELAYANEAMRAGWISGAGPFLDRFEREFAAYCGRAHGVAVANGTVALQLAVNALDLPAGSEIIMPSFTIMSCALAAVYEGHTPVFVDCDPETWCMDPAAVAAAVSERTAAIMIVHMYGHPVEVDEILAVAERHGLAVIEDGAEAHGAEYRGRRCGSFGHVSCFSFYANKIVTTGEGGMVLTDDPSLAARLRERRTLSFGHERRFVHEELGFNFRMTNVAAAIGVGQLERIGETIARRRTTAAAYSAAFADLPVQLPVERAHVTNVYWVYGIVLNDALAFDAAYLAAALAELGVQTRPFFTGLHEQPALMERGIGTGPGTMPVTERLGQRGLYLPSGQATTDDDVARVIAAVRSLIGPGGSLVGEA